MAKHILDQNITETLETNYMPYAMSVILSRAIPAIDGFKPAHRKLLYTMYKMGLLRGARTKSTNVVGQTMKLNPHGDAAIYETMVRLTRANETLLHPFIDSKGNFGKVYSRDMAYAASRYTEVKLDPICTEIFKNIDKNTVDLVDNYDGELKEPVLLPVTFPNVLVTANQGIAVGMANNMCSFNLREICEASAAYIEDETADLRKYIKGPDFTTGGQLIYNEDEMNKIYETGRGSFKIRGKYRFDKANSVIEIYEIPYSTNLEVIIEKIISLVKAGKLKEINDVRDETDINGLKIAIDVKRNTDVDKLMRLIYSSTTLMDSFSCNFNILVDNRPQTLGIKQIIAEWLKFRTECVRRQSVFDYDKKKAEHHLLEGLEKILLDIDKAIKIIRETEKESMVVQNLMDGFGIDEIQAEYIAEIRLRNINKEYLMNKIKEKAQTEKDMDALMKLSQSEKLIRRHIASELREVAKKYGKDRKTEVIYDDDMEPVSKDELISDYACRIFLTRENYFKKITLVSLRSSGEQKLKEDDGMLSEFETVNRSEILFFSDKCNVYKVKTYDMNECKASSMGDYLPNVIDMEQDEKIIYMLPVTSYEGYMFFVFRNGKVAKIPLSSYETKLNRKKLTKAYSDKSELAAIIYDKDDIDILLLRNEEKALLFSTSLLTPIATKSGGGVQVFTLKKNSGVSSACRAEEFISDDIEFYRTDKIPAAGHFIADADKENNGIEYNLTLPL